MPLPFWDRALAAAVFDAALVRPSLRTLLAAEAALLLVSFEFFVAIVSSLPKRKHWLINPARNPFWARNLNDCKLGKS